MVSSFRCRRSAAEALSAIGGWADECGSAGCGGDQGAALAESRVCGHSGWAWRFFANSRVTLPKLVEPVRNLAREAVVESRSP